MAKVCRPVTHVLLSLHNGWWIRGLGRMNRDIVSGVKSMLN